MALKWSGAVCLVTWATAGAQKCKAIGPFTDPAYARTTPAPGGAGFDPVAEPWRSLSCCTPKYTQDLKQLGVEYLYSNYSFHHCSIATNGTVGRMSSRCEQFMMWEEAFFACDPYLAYTSASDNTTSFRAPVCKSFCNDWYDACADDYTCVRDWLNDWNFTALGLKCPDNAPCVKFRDMYRNGTDMCTSMWGTSFSVSKNDSQCMNMWWWGQSNPNSYLAPTPSPRPACASDAAPLNTVSIISLVGLCIAIIVVALRG